MNDHSIESALVNVNEVVFSNSLEESQKYYDDWSKSYDDNMATLGSSYAPAAGEMFVKYGKACKIMLDIGVGNTKI